MNTEKVRKVYDLMSQKYNMGQSYEEFEPLMNDDEKRRKVYDLMSQKYNMGQTYDEFSNALVGNAVESTTQANQQVMDSITPDGQFKADDTYLTDADRQDIANTSKMSYREAMKLGQKAYSIAGQRPTADSSQAASQFIDANREAVSQMEETEKLNSRRQAEARTAEAEKNQQLLDISKENAKRMREENNSLEQQYADLTSAAYNYATEQYGPMPTKGLTSESGWGKAYQEYLDNNDPTGIVKRYNDFGARAKRNQTISFLDHMNNQMQRRIDAANYESEHGGAARTARGIVYGLTQPSSWSLGMSDLWTAENVISLANKMKNGEQLTDYEQAALDAYGTYLQMTDALHKLDTRGFKAGETTGAMLPFMIQMALNPAKGVGNEMVKKGVGKAVGKVAGEDAAKVAMEKYGTQATKQILKDYGADGALARVNIALRRVGGDLVSSVALANTLQIGSTMADIAERKYGDPIQMADGHYVFDPKKELSWAQAAYKAETSAIIENFTEMMGEWELLGIAEKASKFGTNAVGRMVRALGNTDFANGLSKVLKDAHWSGVFGEFMEEEYGMLLNALLHTGEGTYGEDFAKQMKQNLTWDQQLDTFLGVALFGGLVGGAKMAAYPIEYNRAKENLNEITTACREFDADWDKTQDAIDNADNTALAAILAHNVKRSNEKMEKGENHAKEDKIVEYIGALQRLRGITIARDMLPGDADEKTLQAFYQQGYDGEDKQAYRAAYEHMKAQWDMIDPYYRQVLDTEGINAQIIDENGNRVNMFDGQYREMARQYLTAKAAWEGTKDGIVSRSRAKAKQAETMVRANDNDGRVIEATLRTGDKVHIISGDVVMNAGAADLNQSSKSIIIRREDGSKEMISPTLILSVDGVQNTEEMARTSAERAAQESLLKEAEETEINDVETGVQAVADVQLGEERGKEQAEYQMNETVEMPDGNNGTVLQGIGQNENGKVQVRWDQPRDGQKVVEYTADELYNLQHPAGTAQETAQDENVQNTEGAVRLSAEEQASLDWDNEHKENALNKLARTREYAEQELAKVNEELAKVNEELDNLPAVEDEQTIKKTEELTKKKKKLETAVEQYTGVLDRVNAVQAGYDIRQSKAEQSATPIENVAPTAKNEPVEVEMPEATAPTLTPAEQKRMKVLENRKRRRGKLTKREQKELDDLQRQIGLPMTDAEVKAEVDGIISRMDMDKAKENAKARIAQLNEEYKSRPLTDEEREEYMRLTDLAYDTHLTEKGEFRKTMEAIRDINMRMQALVDATKDKDGNVIREMTDAEEREYAGLMLVRLRLRQELVTEEDIEDAKRQMKEMEERTGLKMRLITDVNEIDNEEDLINALKSHAWNKGDKEAVFVLAQMKAYGLDFGQMYRHEVLSHYSLKNSMSVKEWNKFLDDVWNVMPEEDKKKLGNDYKQGKNQSEEDYHRLLADEYIAHGAQDIFDYQSPVSRGIVDSVKRWIRGEKNEGSPAEPPILPEFILDKLREIKDQRIERRNEMSDEDIRQSIAYHGSKEDFDKFELTDTPNNSIYRPFGVYTTDKAGRALSYAKGNLYEVEIPDNLFDFNGEFSAEDKKRVIDLIAKNHPERLKRAQREIGKRASYGGYTIADYLTPADMEELGYKGYKRPMGLAAYREGDPLEMVIFNPDDVKILNHYRGTMDDIKEQLDANDIRYSIAYHGSGANFDRFDHSFMNTGEGNQAYGWGTYVTTNEETGKKYADIATARKTNRPYTYVGPKDKYDWHTKDDAIDAMIEYGGFENAKKHFDSQPQSPGTYGDTMQKFFNESSPEEWEGERYLYTVEIPDDNGENYLHWDGVLTQRQSDKIVNALLANPDVVAELGENAEREVKSSLGYGTYGKNVEGALNYFLGDEKNYATGEDPGAERNSRFLNSLGFVGMQVAVDRRGGKRYEGDNYVIYNPDDIKILDKTRFSLAAENEEETIRYSVVTDPETLKMLNESETVPVYRAMTYDEFEKTFGKPMSGKGITSVTTDDKGKRRAGSKKDAIPNEGEIAKKWYKADENQEIAVYDENLGYAHVTIMDDAGGATPVAYNPYIHTSLQMLNDQFAKAWRRPNMVVVKCLIPKWEAEADPATAYKAKWAKNSVGPTTEWNNGPVSKRFKKKPRTVVLSRYVMIDDIVKPEEYAESVKQLLIDNDVLEYGVPFSHVTPEQRDALYNVGVPITEPEGSGRNSQSMAAYKEWRDAVETAENETVVGEQSGIRYSMTSFADALNCEYVKGEGGKTIFRTKDGKEVDSFTPEMVKNSRVGAFIAESERLGQISKDEADKQYQFFADYMNTLMNVNDIDMVFAVTGAMGFVEMPEGEVGDKSDANRDRVSKITAFTNNADAQYSTTIDFTTICLKTQQVIDVMSDVMKRLGRGLTPDEVTDIVYKATHEAGEPVPCPVCYVFSRWVGLGGLLDNMRRLQEEYSDKATEDIQQDIDRLSKQITNIANARKLNLSKGVSALEKELKAQINAITAKYRNKNGLALNMTATDKRKVARLQYDLHILDNWAWLTKVRMNPDYETKGRVPNDILFDINAGKEFADKYPVAWAYRTSRGPAAGKTATPYAPQILGQYVLGTARGGVKKGDGLGDINLLDAMFGTEGEMPEEGKKVIGRAVENAKRQNLLNGQRWQSTSDARPEYFTDYMLVALEHQLVGSKVQLYTKVPEAVGFFASIGAESNLSIMPRGKGVDEEGNLIFSDVTGMDAEDAFTLSDMFDNVQPILVGTNIDVVRAVMKDNRVTFFIPYHASGASEARYDKLMGVVGEMVEKGETDDFSPYQVDIPFEECKDKVDENGNALTDEMIANYKKLRDARMHILTGKRNGKDAKTFTKAEMETINAHPILKNLYERFWVEGKNADCYGVRLDKSQAEGIFPYEYWDNSTTIDTADKNGDAFVQYCYSLGIWPRFSGHSKGSAYNAKFDISRDTEFGTREGYWKSLIDRPMYNNDGTSHQQKPIKITDMSVDFGFRDGKIEFRHPSRANDKAKTQAIVDEVMGRIDEQNTRLSVVGEIGASRDNTTEGITRLENLNVAREMEKELKPDWNDRSDTNALKIKMATGWERGGDGKWRYEIPDAKFKEGALDKKWGNKTTLDDIIDAPELFRMYPDLKDIPVKRETKKGAGGHYSHSENRMYVGTGDYTAWKKLRDEANTAAVDRTEYYEKYMNLWKDVATNIMNHELQHTIQAREGFARGGNAGEFREGFDEEAFIERIKRYNDMVYRWNAMTPFEKTMTRGLLDDIRRESRAINRERAANVIGKEGYRRLGGEVEARNVETRRKMTDEERRNTLLVQTEDVYRKDQNFLFRAIRGLEDSNNDTRYSAENLDQRIFVSNAARAVEKIQQEKATPEQWLAMLQKNGGIKAGEDKWLGLSQWLKEQDGKISKNEILEFIDQNGIKIEEYHYSENVDREKVIQDDIRERIGQGKSLEELQEEVDANAESADRYDRLGEEPDAAELDEYLMECMIDEYGDDFAIGYMIEDGELEYNVPESWDYEDADFNKEVAGTDNRIIDATRLRYTSDGLDNKREIALTVPTIEPWMTGDDIHFGDAGEGRAIAWIRFGDARTGYNGEEGSRTIMNELERKYGSPDATEKMTDEDVARRVYANYLYRGDNADMDVLKNGIANMVSEDRVDNVTRLFEQIFDEREEGDRVLFIDEIQSNRHQQGREEGYKIDNTAKRNAIIAEINKLRKRRKELYNQNNKVENEEISNLGNEIKRLEEEENKLFHNEKSVGVPAAPFEKNWAELAMKRMLRLAAEEGYDKVAWTPGQQQADRYNLGEYIENVNASDWQDMSDTFGDDENENDQTYTNVKEIRTDSDSEVELDIIVDRNGVILTDINDTFTGHKLSEVLGESAARDLLKDGEQYYGSAQFKLGNDGMSTFYDQILVNFMNKYGKQWGVKVEDLNLPDVENGNYTFHSINVTDQMKKDVMEGQTMFSIAGDFASALDDLETKGISIDDENLLDAYGLSNVTLTKKGDNVTLTHFIADDKGKGNGTRFMDDLTKLADGNGWTLALTPDASFGATSVKRLKDFYKRFGFKDNKGRNTDFEINESMIRKPEENTRYSVTPEQDAEYRKAYEEGNTEKAAQMVKDAFKAMYPDTKVVDENGEPLTMYHGTTTAGFNVFKPREGSDTMGWFTTSKRDADSYAGNAEGKLYDSREKASNEILTAGSFPLGKHFVFDSQEELDDFVKRFPNASDYMTEREIDDALFNVESDEEEARLESLRDEYKKMRDAYRKYEREHMVDTTIGELLDNPNAYSAEDFERAMYAFDSNAYLDEVEEMEPEDEKRELVDALKRYDEESKADGDGGIRNIRFKSRVPRGGSAVKADDTNRRTYATYLNITNPLFIDAKGKHSELESGDIYNGIWMGLDDNRYDGIIIKNWRVGRYQDLGTVAIPKSASQIKLANTFTFDDNGELIPLSERFNDENNDIRYSFVGERAASALKQNSGEWYMLYDLGQARIMKEQGRSPEWIKDVTGWEQGADGEWRYEMEDFILRPDYTDAQTIGEAVEDNRLLKAYPDLKDMKVQFKHIDTPHSSYYDGKGFFVEYDNDDTAAKGLMHEVQHYIQVQEGFAEGANTDTFSDGKEHPLFNMDSNAVERVMAKANVAWDVDDNADLEDISKKIDESKEGSAKYETYSEIYIMAASGMSIREAKDQIIAYAKNLTNDAVYLYSDPQSPLNKYRRTAGEVEARNVENRYNMTFEERMKSLASATEDVARENQIVIINGAIREYEEEIDPIMSPLTSTAGTRYSISVEPSRIRSEYNDGDIKVYNPRDIADVQASVMRESYTHKDIRTMDGWDDLRDTAYRLSDGEIARRAVANGMDFDSAIEGWMYENAERMVVPFSRMLSRNGIDLMYEMTGDEIRMYLMSSNDLLDGAERFLMKEDLPVKESIRYSMASAPSARELYDASQGSFMNNLYRSYVDYTKPLRDLQEIIAKTSGKPIADLENALEAENQRSSKNKSEIEQFELRHFEKMRDAVKALRKATGMKYNDVLRYLIAKHGLERNVVLAERDAAATVATQQDLDNYRTKLTKNLADLKFQENQLVNQVAADADEQKIIDNKLKRIRKRIDNLERILAMNDDDFKQEVHDIEFKKNRKSDYSGLTALTGKNKVSDAEDGARTIVADVETRAKAESENLWKIIADAVDAIQKKKYESGMISKERMQHEKDMFEHYIPLRGFADPIAEDFYDYYGDTYRNRPQRDKKAKGRRSLADDPIATLGAMAASAIIEGNKNLVKQRFLNLVDNHPNDLATLKEGWVVNNGTPENPKWEPAYPVIKEDMDADAINAELKDYDKRMEMLQAMGLAKKVSNKLNIKWRTLGQQEQQHIITVRRNGKEQMIIINGNPQVARTLNGVNNPDANLSKAMRGVRAVQRFMAANFTTRNPAFVVSNLMRDYGFAIMAVTAKEDADYRHQFFKNMAGQVRLGGAGLGVIYKPVKVGKLLNKWKSGTLDMNNEEEKYFAEFMTNGGETGYTAENTVDAYRKKMEKGLKENKAVKIGQVVLDACDLCNRAVEDYTRFMTYMTSRQMGRSVQRSVADAKNITVNFNRKGSGEMGQKYVASAFLFLNAGIQSLQNVAKMSGIEFSANDKGKVRVKVNGKQFAKGTATLFGSQILLGFIAPMLNELAMGLLGGDDDDEPMLDAYGKPITTNPYRRLTEFERRNNLCIWIGGDHFIKIPLAIELRAFYGLGETMYGYMAGIPNPNPGADVMSQLLDLLPVNFVEKGGLWPDVAAPWVETLIFNRNYQGIPIYNDSEYLKNEPEANKVYSNTGDAYIALSRWINELGGGDEISKGKLDGTLTNPAVMQHIVEGYLGGLLTTARQTAHLIGQPVQKFIMGKDVESIPARELPIVNRLYVNTDKRNDDRYIKDRYYFYRNWADKYQHDLNGYKNSNDPQYQRKYIDMIKSPEYMDYIVFDAMNEEVRKAHKDVKDYGDQFKIFEMDAIRRLVNVMDEDMQQDSRISPEDWGKNLKGGGKNKGE